jgi:nitroimidazol reductase NimA-like FMN-containing flavoprotein (pyridoxamine 5'-phosphate oxidase superfamily)
VQAPSTIAPTERTRVRRRAGRGEYERGVIDTILDEGLVAHVGICDAEGQPYVIPVIYARAGDQIYVHGSALSRLLGTMGNGARVCLTVTLLDGVVLARSAFHSSMNYRSVVVLGEPRAITEENEQRAALRAIVEHIARGRADETRGPDRQELEATAVVALPLNEASAKIRTGQPVDAGEDYELPFWAGIVPLRLEAGEPITDPRCSAATPAYARDYTRDDLIGSA